MTTPRFLVSRPLLVRPGRDAVAAVAAGELVADVDQSRDDRRIWAGRFRADPLVDTANDSGGIACPVALGPDREDGGDRAAALADVSVARVADAVEAIADGIQQIGVADILRITDSVVNDGPAAEVGIADAAGVGPRACVVAPGTELRLVPYECSSAQIASQTAGS